MDGLEDPEWKDGKPKKAAKNGVIIFAVYQRTCPDWLRAVRGQWSIKNNLRWVLDVTFGEDRFQVTDSRERRAWAWWRAV